jgi:nitrous oxidase accessory protein NosD
LDATNTVNGGVLAFNGVEGPFTGFAEDVRLVGNHLVCGGERVEPCISIRSHVDSGILGVLLAGNDIESGQIQTTIDLEGVHNWRIEGNTIGEGPGAIGDPEVLLGSPGGRFTGNTVQCGGTCFFADGSPRLVVANNQFQSAAAGTGVHLQLGTDGDSVVANTVVTASPSDALQLGGIRVRDGANVVLADNIVRGPWANSMAVTDLTGGDIERNSLAGAGGYGIRLASGASFVPISMTGNRFLANRVTGAALAGISAQLACGNSFIGNDLQGNAGNVGLVFNETTGANTYAGNATLVVDNGAFDCDGDGVNDPNIISGPGMARHGLQLGNGASGTGPVRTVRGITVQ